MPMQTMRNMNGRPCACGKIHRFDTPIVSGRGVLKQLPELIAGQKGSKAFVLSDKNTWNAAGRQVCSLLETAGIPFVSHSFREDAVEPDEKTVGSAVMHMAADCDIILAVGSGVVNDTGKILSALSGKPYIIIATAPSMDGYASATSSMTRDGLKCSLPSRCPDVIVGDTEILCQAPLKLLKSGLGDMIAKYVSICEWRIAHLLLGEYYCEDIANLIRSAVKRCVDNAQGLLRREEEAVAAVFEGLVIGGVAMNYAGLSRPASGVEHYLSHVVDMRAVQFGTPMELHGIQCAIGTLAAVRLYEKLLTHTPNRERALAAAAAFDREAWNRQLREYLGVAAESMIALEEKEGKYDLASHALRLETILARWEDIREIARQELPTSAELETLLDTIEAPRKLSDIGIDDGELPMIFKASKDIRDKYVLSRLAWDLGILEELVPETVETVPVYAEGHRGFCARYPENTLLSFEKAMELGVDAVEFDIWLSSDKVPVLMHDGSPLRTCGVVGHLRDMTLAEIKKLDPCYAEKFGETFRGKVEVPTLYELLELRQAKRPDMKLGVEIKEYTEETVDITVKALKEYGVFERCWFYAFNGRILRYLKEKYNARTMGYPDFQMAEFCGYDCYDEIGLSMRIVNSEVCDRFLAKGLPVHMYCADNREDVALCLKKGASLITANDPEPLLQALGRK